MITYPNQKIVHINKETSSDFLQVDKSAWMQAGQVLTYGAFKLYLYLAGNQDGFDKALSPTDVEAKIGLSESTYRRSVKELTKEKYLVLKQGNIYDFYTEPNETKEDKTNDSLSPVVDDTLSCMNTLPCHARLDNPVIDEQVTLSQVTREIDKRDKRDIFYIKDDSDKSSSSAASQPERKKELKELSNEELKDLLKDYQSEVKYPELYKKYNLLRGQLDKELPNKIDAIISERDKEDKYKSIKERLNDKDTEELMHLMGIENEEELLDCLSGLTVDFNSCELIVFLEENDMFTHKVWIRDYAYKEDYRNQTYFEWFVNGVNRNYW
jgi:hypothetical protein